MGWGVGFEPPGGYDFETGAEGLAPKAEGSWRVAEEDGTASDTSLLHGLVGVGSFDDTGSFDDLMLWGEAGNRPKSPS